jgi:hypothetical protein
MDIYTVDRVEIKEIRGTIEFCSVNYHSLCGYAQVRSYTKKDRMIDWKS